MTKNFAVHFIFALRNNFELNNVLLNPPQVLELLELERITISISPTTKMHLVISHKLTLIRTRRIQLNATKVQKR